MSLRIEGAFKFKFKFKLFVQIKYYFPSKRLATLRTTPAVTSEIQFSSPWVNNRALKGTVRVDQRGGKFEVSNYYYLLVIRL